MSCCAPNTPYAYISAVLQSASTARVAINQRFSFQLPLSHPIDQKFIIMKFTKSRIEPLRLIPLSIYVLWGVKRKEKNPLSWRIVLFLGVLYLTLRLRRKILFRLGFQPARSQLCKSSTRSRMCSYSTQRLALYTLFSCCII